MIGQQFAGRVGLFLRVEDFDASYQRMVDGGVRFVSEPRVEAYGKFAVFLDLEGNRWDLLGLDPRESARSIQSARPVKKTDRSHKTASCLRNYLDELSASRTCVPKSLTTRTSKMRH